MFLVRQVGTTDMAAIDVVQSLFPDKQVDFVLSINETDIALIKQPPTARESKDLYKVAEQVEAALRSELNLKVDRRGTIVTSHPGVGTCLQGGPGGHRRGQGV